MLGFIHIRKTAGSTIDMILRQSFGAKHLRVRLGKHRSADPVAGAADLRRCRWIYWHLEALSGHGIVPYSDLSSLFPTLRYFTFLRDPLARCASDYQFRVTRGDLRQPFRTWVHSDLAANQQTRKIAGVSDAGAAIEILRKQIGFVGLVEKFDESLVLWRHWAASQLLDIRCCPKNVARDNTLKRQLLSDSRTRAWLQEANREDMRLYEYVVKEVFPRAVAAYGPSLARDVRQHQANNVPPPVFPRGIPQVLLRELVYKPLAGVLRRPTNPSIPRQFV